MTGTAQPSEASVEAAAQDELLCAWAVRQRDARMDRAFSNLARLRWSLAPQEIVKGATEAIGRLRTAYDSITRTVAEGGVVSLDTVLRPIVAAQTDFVAERSAFTFPQNVAAAKSVRDASHEAAKLISNFIVESSMRTDIYEAYKKLDEVTRSTGPPLPYEYDRCVPARSRDRAPPCLTRSTPQLS